jgi:Fe-S cluster assembly iron-binding protein IscA
MDIAEEARSGDVTLEKNGLRVFLEKEADRLLSEATIDYSGERGITINGMVRSSCCG